MKTVRSEDSNATQTHQGEHPNIRLSQNVRILRKERGYNLEKLAKLSGLSISTLSKIENNQISPTFDTLVALASGLDLEVGAIISPVHTVSKTGRRAVSRQGQGVSLETPVYDYSFLCPEISDKKFIPILATLKAGSVTEFQALSSHEGEEFFYVLSGKVILHTDLYKPTELEAGDSTYFDSTMGHALVSAEKETKVLWISSSLGHISEPDLNGS